MGTGAVVGLLILALIDGDVAQAQQPTWVANLVLRIGAEDGPGALAEVFDLEVAPRGEILIAQPQLGTIALFAGDGRHLRSIGRRGQGPGEFQVLGRMGWTRDSLYVLDFGRLHLFDADFQYARSVTFPTLRPPAGVTRMIPGPILADGSILGIPIFVDSGRAAPVVRLSERGQVMDTLAHVLTRDAYVRVPVSGQTRPGNVLRPWIDNPLWASAPDGASLVIVNRPLPDRSRAASFEIVRIGLNGDTLMRHTVSYNPVERGRAQVDQWYASAARSISVQLSVTEAQAERALRTTVEPPRFHLPVTRLVIGSDGTIWLRREDTLNAATDWQLLDRTGRVLGFVPLPTGFEAHRTQIDRVWGVQKDSLGVPYLHIYEITRSN